jgi:hypothetical protein
MAEKRKGLGGRRRRKQDTTARARLATIAADVYDDGDSYKTFEGKMRQAVSAEAADKPFKALLLKFLEMLLPLLFQLLTGKPS